MKYYNMICNITSSMIAWNEIWQGYPDHWVKVHGDLIVLANSIDDDNLKKDILDEANHFYKMYLDGMKYRPPFEKYACLIMNLDANKEVIKKNEIINGSMCINCALKHLAEAKISFDKIEDFNEFIKVIGNMSHASNHLVEDNEVLANYIRDERTKFYNSYIDKIDIYEPNFEIIINNVKNMINN